MCAQIEREKIRECHRHAIEHLLQRTHRRTYPVLFDQRYRAVRDAGAFRQFALRQAVHHAHRTQMRADVNAHRRASLEPLGQRRLG
jgi:hypothetical protein